MSDTHKTPNGRLLILQIQELLGHPLPHSVTAPTHTENEITVRKDVKLRWMVLKSAATINYRPVD